MNKLYVNRQSRIKKRTSFVVENEMTRTSNINAKNSNQTKPTDLEREVMKKKWPNQGQTILRYLNTEVNLKIKTRSLVKKRHDYPKRLKSS